MSKDNDEFTEKDAVTVTTVHQDENSVTLKRKPRPSGLTSVLDTPAEHLVEGNPYSQIINVECVTPKARFVEEAFEGMDETLAAQIKWRYKESGHATSGSAAYDLRYVGKEPLILQPGEMATVHSGVAMHLGHPNFVGLILPRSGLGCKGVVLGNLVGVIDSDYQGELKLALWNRHETETHRVMEIQPGERVAQYVVTKCYPVNPQWVDEFDTVTERGDKGFGSSGKD